MILEHVRRHLVVLDRLRVSEWAKRPHAGGLEVRPVRVIDLEIKRVVVDEREEKRVRVDPHAAEHAPRGDARHAFELLDDVCEIVIADGHLRIRAYQECAGGASR